MFKIKIKQRDNTHFIHEDSFVHLQHTKGRSADYKLFIRPPEAALDLRSWEVWSEYGRIGSGLRSSKIGGYNSLEDARKYFNRKIKEQRTKGYEIVTQRL